MLSPFVHRISHSFALALEECGHQIGDDFSRLFFFFFLHQKDMNVTIIPGKSRINATRKWSPWKASRSPAVCHSEKLSNWAAGWV